MKKPLKQCIIPVSLLFLLLASGAIALLFAPRFSARAFAAAMDSKAVTCNVQPDFSHCTNRDPVDQQCVTPATTTVSRDIVAPNGIIVGRVDRRYSLICHTWWGRVFDYRHGKGEYMTILVGDALNTLSFHAVGFSNMVFDAVNAPAPVVIGTLTTGGKLDPTLSATIPAVAPPAA